ncbi:MAG: hypothetical protein LH606_14170 [Cytophagaceae bacterium]|nr:hypothetical protein [Cytophagaceae bacterium]
MRPFSAFVLILLFVTACQTEKAGFRNRPLRSSAEMTTITSDTNYLRIRPRAGRKLLLIDKQKQRQVASLDTLWGYETKAGTRYRYVKKTYYKMEEISPLTIYSNTYDIQTANGSVSQTDHYFSRNPDSELIALSKRNLRRTFQNDPALLEKLAGRRWRLYDRKAKRYVLNQVYEEVHRM